MAKLLTIGNITLDEIVLPDRTVMSASPGGGVLYSAAGAKIWSPEEGNIRIISKIGEDYPQESIDRIQDFGFDVSGVRRVPGKNIHVWLLYEEEGKRQITFFLDSGKSPAMDPQAEDYDIKNGDVAFAHIAPMATSSQLGFINGLAEQRINFTLDLAVVRDEIDPRDIQKQDGLKKCRIFLPSEQEVQAVWGRPVDHDLLRQISTEGPEVVAVKMGGQGSLVYDRDRDLVHFVPALAVDARDTTGAGDAYCGGFMAGYLATGSALQAALMATVSASYAVEHFGALNFLSANFEDAGARLDDLRGQVRTE